MVTLTLLPVATRISFFGIFSSVFICTKILAPNMRSATFCAYKSKGSHYGHKTLSLRFPACVQKIQSHVLTVWSLIVDL